MMGGEDEETLQGQAEIWKHMFAFADSMVLKCAVQLGIADIINTKGRPLTVNEIAEHLPSSSSPDIQCLTHIMRLLARKHIFGVHLEPNGGGNTLYSLAPASKWLLRDAEQTLAPLVLMVNDPISMASWQCLSDCVMEGGTAFEKAHGCGIFELAGRNPRFNKVVNEAMGCTSKLSIDLILLEYGHGFEGLTSLVDVGGGIGVAIREIVKCYPNIKGINYDLPHVVAMAPQYHGVEHVSGDMFKDIPPADAVFMKLIMHNWGDEDCVKILKNCRKAIPESTGKVIIVDMVRQPKEEERFADYTAVADLAMVTQSPGGKERTEGEWKEVLEEGGFPRYNIINIPTVVSLIEAFPG